MDNKIIFKTIISKIALDKKIMMKIIFISTLTWKNVESFYITLNAKTISWPRVLLSKHFGECNITLSKHQFCYDNMKADKYVFTFDFLATFSFWFYLFELRKTKSLYDKFLNYFIPKYCLKYIPMILKYFFLKLE